MTDEAFYEVIAKELEDGNVRKGLWLQATTQANGDEGRAKAFYVKQRLKELKASGLPASEPSSITAPAKSVAEFAAKQIYIAERLNERKPATDSAVPDRPRRRIDWPGWLLLLSLALIHSSVLLHYQGKFHGEIFAYLLPAILGGAVASLVFPLLICVFVKPPGRYWVAFVGFLLVAFFMTIGTLYPSAK